MLCFLFCFYNDVSADPFSIFENCLMSLTFQNMNIMLISSFYGKKVSSHQMRISANQPNFVAFLNLVKIKWNRIKLLKVRRS